MRWSQPRTKLTIFPVIKKLTRLSPKSFFVVANKIIDQISASTKIQNAIFVRKRDSSPKCPEKGKGATSKEDFTKSAFFFFDNFFY